MEIINTLVHRNPALPTVEFLGEGGEAIRVAIASGDAARTDEELVETAKQMMVQVVAFDRPDLYEDHAQGRAASIRSSIRTRAW